ncbi:MAG: sodium:solute symporter family transporter [Steroidobacter sp.]
MLLILARVLATASRSLTRFVALCVLASGAISTSQAENLVSIETGRIASLPGSASLSRVVVVDGRALAIGADFAWVLEGNKKAWTQIDWRPRMQVLGAAGDGTEGFLLLGSDDTVERVAKLSLTAGKPVLQPLPSLPVPLASTQAAFSNGSLHVAGLGEDGALHLLGINLTAVQPAWMKHAVWTGEVNRVTSIVAQGSSVYVTLAGAEGQGDRMLQWNAADGWTERTALPGAVVEGAARAIGQAHALYVVDGASAPLLLSFHTITGSWANLARLDAQGIRSGALWNDGILWTRPGADDSGAQFGFAQLESTQLLLKSLDWLVIVIYLAGMSSIGLYFYLREKRQSTADFFVGSRSIPFWAAGVSLYATNTSSISFIAIPAKAFETNWQYLTNNLVAVLGLMFVAVWIVPLLRRLDLMSVFHYLEIRFHPVIRMLASALCIAMQVGSRLSVVLFLPSLAISTITGIDVVWGILIMGVITIIYTALGGMKAVIWTDFVQLFVMFGGALFAIGFIISRLDGGAGEFFAIAASENKMKLFDWSWDLTQATVWGFLFLVVFDVVLTFPKDQVLMQRVLSTSSAKQAGWSVWTMAAIMIPGGFMFYFIGTALYVFYQSHPERMNPLLTNDATFPLFIAAELPMGVTGLIIAGILAASMSTLSSIMNSVATLASVDFYEKFVKNADTKTSVRFAEAMTVVTGLIGMGLAFMLSRYDIRSLFDVSIELAGLLGGGFAGAYTLGMFTRRANWQGVAIGIAAAIVLTTLAWSMNLVHPYFYLAISILICIVVGYLASLFFPPPDRSLVGLTIHEPRPKGDMKESLASATS